MQNQCVFQGSLGCTLLNVKFPPFDKHEFPPDNKKRSRVCD